MTPDTRYQWGYRMGAKAGEALIAAMLTGAYVVGSALCGIGLLVLVPVALIVLAVGLPAVLVLAIGVFLTGVGRAAPDQVKTQPEVASAAVWDRAITEDEIMRAVLESAPTQGQH